VRLREEKESLSLISIDAVLWLNPATIIFIAKKIDEMLGRGKTVVAMEPRQ